MLAEENQALPTTQSLTRNKCASANTSAQQLPADSAERKWWSPNGVDGRHYSSLFGLGGRGNFRRRFRILRRAAASIHLPFLFGTGTAEKLRQNVGQASRLPDCQGGPDACPTILCSRSSSSACPRTIASSISRAHGAARPAPRRGIFTRSLRVQITSALRGAMRATASPAPAHAARRGSDRAARAAPAHPRPAAASVWRKPAGFPIPQNAATGRPDERRQLLRLAALSHQPSRPLRELQPQRRGARLIARSQISRRRAHRPHRSDRPITSARADGSHRLCNDPRRQGRPCLTAPASSERCEIAGDAAVLKGVIRRSRLPRVRAEPLPLRKSDRDSAIAVRPAPHGRLQRLVIRLARPKP